jgi:hypothetical protein
LVTYSTEQVSHLELASDRTSNQYSKCTILLWYGQYGRWAR